MEEWIQYVLENSAPNVRQAITQLAYIQRNYLQDEEDQKSFWKFVIDLIAKNIKID